MKNRLENIDLYNEYGILNRDFSSFDLTDTSNPVVKALKEKIEYEIINSKILSHFKIPGLDLSDIPESAFQNVHVEFTDFEGCNVNLDPQIIYIENDEEIVGGLEGTNLKGNDLSQKIFTGINITGANLTNTNANIDLNQINSNDLSQTKLLGCNVIGSIGNKFYGEHTFSDEYKKKHPKYFLADNVPEELKDAFYSSSFSLFDNSIDNIKKYMGHLDGKNLERFEFSSPYIKIFNYLGGKKVIEIIPNYSDIDDALVDVKLLRETIENDEFELKQDNKSLTNNDYEDNLLFSRQSVEKQNQILELARKYKPQYKSRLGINQNITFGGEIEANNIDQDKLRDEFIDDPIRFGFGRWKSVTEETVGANGGEVVSPPLYDCPEAWKQIEDVCNKIRSFGGEINYGCGGHVHFGANILKNSQKKWVTLFKTMAAFEDVIFRLAGGEPIEEKQEIAKVRNGIEKYAQPVAPFLKHLIKGGITINSQEDLKRFAATYGEYANENAHYQAFNLENIADGNKSKYTIEFRHANGTLNPVQWQTNVLMFAEIMGAAIDIAKNPHGERAKLLEEWYQKGYKYNAQGDLSKMFAFSDVICTKKEDKLRLAKLWDKTKEFDLTKIYKDAESKIEKKKSTDKNLAYSLSR